MSRKFMVPIVLPADPVAAMEAATKQYVDLMNEVFVGPSEPPTTYELWVDSDDDTGGGGGGSSTPVPWIAMTPLINGWANFGDPGHAPGYRKVGDIVYLRGLVRSGTVGAGIFQLPAGYRPPKQVYTVGVANDAFCQNRVQTDGYVVAQSGNNTWWSIDGVAFSVTA